MDFSSVNAFNMDDGSAMQLKGLKYKDNHKLLCRFENTINTAGAINNILCVAPVVAGKNHTANETIAQSLSMIATAIAVVGLVAFLLS